MIHANLLPDKSLLVVKPEGVLHQSDFAQIAQLVDPYLAKNGELNGLMVLIPSFPHWDSFRTLLTHFRFANEHQKKIKRIAIVTDDNIIAVIPDLILHFVHAEVRRFAYQEQEQALAWLQEKTAPR